MYCGLIGGNDGFSPGSQSLPFNYCFCLAHAGPSTLHNCTEYNLFQALEKEIKVKLNDAATRIISEVIFYFTYR